jgi:diacylglycerol kinase (ATP)
VIDQKPFFFIVNPNAGLGGRRFPGIASRLRERGVAFSAAATTGPGDAVVLSRLAAAGQFAAIVCVGGDGTFNEVVNGLATVDGGLDDRTPLGLIPSGTAQDSARGLGIPLDRDAALRRLLEGREARIDVGRIRFDDGRVHLFVNVAGAGFDAEVAERAAEVRGVAVASLPAHMVGFATALAGYRNKEISITFEDDPRPARRLRCNLLIVANGPSYAGMMQLAPDAVLDDGELDVVVIGDVAKMELLLAIPRAMTGSHLAHEKVTAYRSRAIRLDSTDGALLQADGEVVGRLPARIDVLPGALRVIR